VPEVRANGPALAAELRGGYPDLGADQLATIDQPTLLVAGRDPSSRASRR
jgi:hypothetical protein